MSPIKVREGAGVRFQPASLGRSHRGGMAVFVSQGTMPLRGNKSPDHVICQPLGSQLGRGLGTWVTLRRVAGEQEVFPCSRDPMRCWFSSLQRDPCLLALPGHPLPLSINLASEIRVPHQNLLCRSRLDYEFIC